MKPPTERPTCSCGKAAFRRSDSSPSMRNWCLVGKIGGIGVPSLTKGPHSASSLIRGNLLSPLPAEYRSEIVEHRPDTRRRRSVAPYPTRRAINGAGTSVVRIVPAASPRPRAVLRTARCSEHSPDCSGLPYTRDTQTEALSRPVRRGQNARRNPQNPLNAIWLLDSYVNQL